jgi:signal transduction histidine kinase
MTVSVLTLKRQPRQESRRGYGLFSIEERMTDLGGSLEIESEPGKGCRAVLTVPGETEKG